MAGTNIILRDVEPGAIYSAILEHRVTHFCAAPVVLNMISNAPPHLRKPLPGRVDINTGGASPPPSMLMQMEKEGFSILHAYGLTEAHGPLTVCSWKAEWNNLPEN